MLEGIVHPRANGRPLEVSRDLVSALSRSVMGPALMRIAPRRRAVRAVTRLKLARVPQPVRAGRTRTWRRVERAMDLAGEHSGCIFVDVRTGATLFERAATVARPTASVEKLLTAAVVIDRLGAGRRLKTTVYAQRRPDAHGALPGDLYLQGGGDPTLGSDAMVISRFASRGTSISELARNVVERTGLRRVEGAIVGDGSAFHSDGRGSFSSAGALTVDLASGVPVGSDAAIGAAIVFIDALRQLGVEVLGEPRSAPTPPDAVQLTEIESAPLVDLVALMFAKSECLIAEQMTKLLGRECQGEGSTAAGVGVISDTLAHWGLDARVVDGSGWSARNEISPVHLATFLREMSHTPIGDVLRRSLPIAGRSGTLGHRMRGTAADGRCNAKTGTLPFTLVSNLAGWCDLADGPAVFAVMMGGLDFNVAQVLQDAMLADFAAA